MDPLLIAMFAIGAADIALVWINVRAHVRQARRLAQLDRQP